MTERHLHFVIPGDPAQLTGGYLYDRRITQGLTQLGWQISTHGLPGLYPLGDAAAAQAVERCLDQLPEGALVIIDGLAFGASALALERHAERLRLIALVHHPLADETGLDAATSERLRAAERRSLNAVRGIITTSAFTRQRVAAYGIPPRRILVAPPGTAAAFPAEAGSGSSLRLLCVASLIPRKGHLVLVEALAALRDRQWQCHLVGDTARAPNHTEAVRARIHACGLETRISLSGELTPEQLVEVYRGSDLFVLATYYEGFGMVLTEAVAHGLPVIATTGGAAGEAVPATAARFVSPGDSSALAAALAKVMDDPDERQRLRIGALQARRNLPDWTQAAACFADHLAYFAP